MNDTLELFSQIPEQYRAEIAKYYLGTKGKVSGPLIHGCFKKGEIEKMDIVGLLSMTLIELAKQSDHLHEIMLNYEINKPRPSIVVKI